MWVDSGGHFWRVISGIRVAVGHVAECGGQPEVVW